MSRVESEGRREQWRDEEGEGGNALRGRGRKREGEG